MKRETAQECLNRVQTYVKTKYKEDIALPLMDSDHLELPEGMFSTYLEGVYVPDHEGTYMITAIGRAILDGLIKLPNGVHAELYSHVELYFYEN